MFKGKSTLRKDEPKKPVQQNAALQAYLKKYTDVGDEPSHKKRKKAKPKAAAGQLAGAVQIVDNDVSGFERPVARRGPPVPAEDEGSEEEEEELGPGACCCGCQLMLLCCI